MPPITVQRIEADNNGGFYIEWRDAANWDGLPLIGYFHLTEQSIVELIIHQKRPNRAPEDKLLDVIAKLTEQAPQALVAQAFRGAYEEVLQDRIDRHNFGMKAVTSHGHADLEAVRGGAPVRTHNKVDPRPEGFTQFIEEAEK